MIKQTVVERVEVPVAACPSDDQLRDAAIAASRATYANAPGGTRSCACPTDTYGNRGVTLSCNGAGAIRPSGWVMCERTHVFDEVVSEMKTKIAACVKS